MVHLRWLLLCLGVAAHAQDPFEIQVFEYDPLPRGAYSYDAHINYQPNASMLRFSSEWTAGINDQARAGLVLLTADVPGRGVEVAGFRILPQWYAPHSWRLPLNVGLAAEFSLERPVFDENTRQLELRGIVEKHVGRLQLDGNLVFARALHGPDTRDGWGLEPSARVGWQAWRSLTPSIEYYGALREGAHLLFPGADWKIGERLTWSFGVGLDAGGSGQQLILKSRLEFEFGQSHTGH
jgi:hypothetical protein